MDELKKGIGKKEYRIVVNQRYIKRLSVLAAMNGIKSKCYHLVNSDGSAIEFSNFTEELCNDIINQFESEGIHAYEHKEKYTGLPTKCSG